MKTKTRRQKEVDDYVLTDNDSRKVRLSELFGTKEHLIILHNMGETCPNCALWGDEFNGMLRHLRKVAAFCAVGPDDPRIQRAYVKERRWKFKLVSAKGTRFIEQMGFADEHGNPEPGVTILHKCKEGEIAVETQVNVSRDARAPSVLEVLWMIPGIEVEKLAGV